MGGWSCPIPGSTPVLIDFQGNLLIHDPLRSVSGVAAGLFDAPVLFSRIEVAARCLICEPHAQRNLDLPAAVNIVLNLPADTQHVCD